jgi:hypothetical protein
MKPQHARRVTIPEGTSPVFLPIGTVSENEVAVLGSMGELFVRGGSNSALDQYARWMQTEHQAELERIVTGWTALIRDRHQRVTTLGPRFFQTLIPEKSSLYPHLLPEEYRHIDGPTLALARINAALSVHADYVDAFAVLDGDESTYPMWPRTGSHWTPAGARALTVDIVRRIDTGAAAAVRAVPLSSSAAIEADLGQHLLGPRVSETAPAPDAEAMPFGTRLTKLQYDYDSKPKVSAWRCEDPLIDQRVLIFGNSYTQVAPMMDRLSWWIARVFRESKFIWTPEVQDEVIEDYQPDIVIAQGIERFLPTVPKR